MLSESFAMREEPPSFLLFPPEGRSRHFSQKRKRKKRRSIGIRHHGGRRFLSAEERKRKKKKRKKGILLSAGLPSLGKERREKAGVSILWSGSSLLQKKGNASKCGIRKRRTREAFSGI